MSKKNSGLSGSSDGSDASLRPAGTFSNILVGTASTSAVERVGIVVERFRVNPEATAEALQFINTLKPNDIGLVHQRQMAPAAAGYDGSLNDDAFVALAGMMWSEQKKATDQKHERDLVDTSGRNQIITHLIAAFAGFVTTLLVRSTFRQLATLGFLTKQDAVHLEGVSEALGRPRWASFQVNHAFSPSCWGSTAPHKLSHGNTDALLTALDAAIESSAPADLPQTYRLPLAIYWLADRLADALDIEPHGAALQVALAADIAADSMYDLDSDGPPME